MKAPKKIPGIFGLLVLLVGVAITVYLAGTTTHLFQQAAPSENPEDIRITNVTDTSFTVTYKTQNSYPGTIHMGEGNSSQTILDDRDQKSGTPHEYVLHSITAKNLVPDTGYSFSILSGTTTFLNKDQQFSVKTAGTLSTPPSSTTPLTGKIVASDGTNPTEALIFATTENGQTVSTLTDTDGTYILPINTIRNKDLSEQLTLTDSSVFQLLVVSPTNTAQASLSLAVSNPIPLISLGQQYDFTQSTTPIASSSAAGGFPAFSLDESLRATPQILTPAISDQGFTDPQPLFKGTAPPNEEVTITIHSDEVITKTITTDANGNWSFRPNTPLSPGLHTITISVKNSAGIVQTLQRSFTVYAAGTQVNESATPSATLTPKPTATPIPTKAVTPTTAPTVTIATTPTPTVTPSTQQNTTTITPSTKPAPTLPPTGSNATVIIGITGIVTTLIGMMIFLLTRGAVL